VTFSEGFVVLHLWMSRPASRTVVINKGMVNFFMRDYL